MSNKKVPQVVKDSFYLIYCNPKNYKELTIKTNIITKQLEQIYNNNISAKMQTAIGYPVMEQSLIVGQHQQYMPVKMVCD